MSGFTEIEIPETLRLEDAPAEETAPEEQQPREPTARERMLAQIAEGRERAIARELAYGVEMENEARVAGGGEAIHDPEPAPQLTHAPPATEPAPVEPTLHRIIIDGQPINVTPEQLQRLAEVGAVASRQQHAPPAPEPTLPPAEAAPAHDRVKLAETWRKISYGSEEEGVDALAALMASAQPQQPAIDPRQMAAEVAQQVRYTQQVESNLYAVVREYPDIFGPSDRAHTPQEAELYQMRAQAAALSLDMVRRRDLALGTQRADLDVYREAANRVRASLTGGTPQPATPQPAPSPAAQAARPDVATSAERLERKRTAPRTPMAISRTAGAAPQERRFPTASEAVAAMAKSRGQQTPTRMN